MNNSACVIILSMLSCTMRIVLKYSVSNRRKRNAGDLKLTQMHVYICHSTHVVNQVRVLHLGKGYKILMANSDFVLCVRTVSGKIVTRCHTSADKQKEHTLLHMLHEKIARDFSFESCEYSPLQILTGI